MAKAVNCYIRSSLMQIVCLFKANAIKLVKPNVTYVLCIEFKLNTANSIQFQLKLLSFA